MKTKSVLAVLGVAAALLAGFLVVSIRGRDRGRRPVAPVTKTLAFWHIQTKGETKAAIDAAVARFTKSHPDVSVEVAAFENDAFKKKLAVAMAAGSPPDVFYTWGGGVLAADAAAGRVLDLTDRVDAAHLATLNAAALEFCRSEGRLYALPADVAAVAFWYNKEIFREHGLEPPKTYAGLLAACAKLKAVGVAPIALGNKDKWPGAFFFSYFALRLGGPEPFARAAARKEGATFEHPSFVEAGRGVQGLVERGYLTKGVNSTDYTRMRQLFFNGEAAMMLMGSFVLGNARKEAPEGFLEKMGCFPFPTVPGGKGEASLVLGGVNAGYAIARGCRHPDAAVALVTELTGAAAAEAWARTGRIPALAPERARALLPPESQAIADVLGRARAIQLYYDQALPPELGEVHKTTTQGLFAGTKTPAEAARLMEQKARAMAEREAP